jgi:uncharacterized protein YndB with AHSA1/START domain
LPAGVYAGREILRTEKAMSAKTAAATNFNLHGDREIVMERVFDAPRDLVWRVTNDPALIPQWWGPAFLTTIVEVMDVRPGGRWRFVQRDASGNEYGFNGQYLEVDPPKRATRTFEFEGARGHIVTETMVLEDLGGRTRMHVTSVFPSAEDRTAMMQEGAEKGARESWERLSTLLDEEHSAARRREDCVIRVTRIFDAPREIVFRAYTDPDRVQVWWGPSGFTTTIHEMDVKTGGHWRFTMHGPDGTDYPNEVVYREVEAPVRLVYVHGPQPKFDVTVTFEDLDGKTRLTMESRFATVAEREMVVREYHAIEGANQEMVRLAEYLGVD